MKIFRFGICSVRCAVGRNKQRPWSKQHTEEVHLGSERKPVARPELWSASPAPLRSAESVDLLHS